jgi:hypothetical protein
MREGDRQFTPENIAAAEAILGDFLDEVAASPLAALRSAVERLNAIGGLRGTMGCFIETMERDELAVFLNTVAKQAGAQGDGDLTEELREW